jgi:hypothetical protein
LDRAQVDEERLGNVQFQVARVGADLPRRAGADHGGADRGVAQYVPERRRGHRDLVPGADLGDMPDPGQDLQRRGRVAVPVAAGQDAAVEHAGRQHPHTAPQAEREQGRSGGLVQQGVPARDHDAVQVGSGDQPGERAGVVHAGADRAHHALVPQLGQGRVRLVHRLRQVVVGVMDEREVDPVEAQPGQALLDRSPHPVPAVVAYPAERRRPVEAVGTLDRAGRGHQQPAHLGRDGELVPWPAGQEVADPPLGQPHPVVRSGVDRPDAGVPGRGEGGTGEFLADRLVQPADGRAAEDEPRHGGAGTQLRHAGPAGNEYSASDSGRISVEAPGASGAR